jgi:hypothetical protein
MYMSSYYYDVLEPKTEQHGSHMVMKNVSKPLKEKIVNIDTKYRTNYDATTAPNMVLGERLTEVRSIEVVSVDVPFTFFNFRADNDCATDGNNYLRIKNGATSKMLVITPNYYPTQAALTTEINAQLSALSLGTDISYSVVNNKSYFKSKTNTYSLATNVDVTGNVNETNNRNNFGWTLGYRDTSYNLTTSGLYSESLLTLKTPRHLFLVLNEFSQGNTNSFVSPLENTNQNKNIIAKICLSTGTTTFGETLCANRANGLLVSETRKYLEKVNIQRISLQLLDDAGRPVQLNGADFSVCLRLVHD